MTMNALLVARLVVIGVLGFSGLSKLGEFEMVKTAATELGLKGKFARFVGAWLAPTELTVAALLLFAATAYAASVAALVLFASFTVLIAWNLWQGLTPPCACFGEAKAEPISNWTLARDLVFVGLALALVLAGPAAMSQGVVGSLALIVRAFGLSATLALLLLLLLLQGAAIAALWSKFGSVARSAANAAKGVSEAPAPADTGWPPGTLAPSFDLPSLAGGRTTLQDLMAAERDVVILFVAPDCRPCTALLPEIASWQERHEKTLTLAIVSRGSANANRDKLGEYTIRNVLLQGLLEVATAYRAEATPAAVVVDRDRRIASRVVNGAVAIRELVETRAALSPNNAPASVLSTAPPADPFSLPIGEPAPPFKLDSMRGGQVDLGDFGGRLVLLVFWNPTCGFCQQLAPELRSWEKAQTEGSVQMVLVSAGSRTANEALAFASPVLLDEGRAVSKTYGSQGTPSAVLIDAESRIASPMAIGGPDVTALAQRGHLLARAARRLEA